MRSRGVDPGHGGRRAEPPAGSRAALPQDAERGPAPRLHEVARREWYAPTESLTNDERIGERFRGIRPAYGYPACPDHSEKHRLLDLLGADRAGIGLTESFATTPGASVSGLYFGHPQARYFSVGRIGRDQVADYAERKGITLSDVERWVRQNLAYEPS